MHTALADRRPRNSMASSRRKASRPVTGITAAISITSCNWSSSKLSIGCTPCGSPRLIDRVRRECDARRPSLKIRR